MAVAWFGLVTAASLVLHRGYRFGMQLLEAPITGALGMVVVRLQAQLSPSSFMRSAFVVL